MTGSLTCEQMRELEARVFKNGATPEQLMDIAGAGIARAILRRYPVAGNAIACLGTGNNGGDALVALRHLASAGWKIGIRCEHPETKLRALPRKKWRELGDCPVNEHVEKHMTCRPLILLDGLLGIGASGPLREPLNDIASWMNSMRNENGADIIAMDIPSGMNGDTGEAYPGAVMADLTLTIGVAKCGLLAPGAANYTGAIESVPVDGLSAPSDGSVCLSDLFSVAPLLPRRPHDFHKGNAGRVGIVAGSRGMLGAAVLASTGALRSGAGLVTLFVDDAIYSTMAPLLPPEVMVKPINDYAEILNENLDVLVIGPGLGTMSDSLFEVISEFNKHLVLDADALNSLARVGGDDLIRPNMILTPHPGEMARLFPQSKNLSRQETVEAFIAKHPDTTLLLKGARTLIKRGSSPIFVNGTGHAGMASGGQGDMLTGVIAGLLGQNLEPLAATRVGAWLCGRAAEMVVSHGSQSIESLTASDVGAWLGMAFRELRC
ncbi:bifunctional NAD(P)H-hydrate repair enzyme Nnr [Oceaniferula spumae]|uniref:Bifunctional NAD(P)H-hydrate repair enzyme n=1 Tax=Oceaniferula spumae TaxID=2979115 RepID=A0AAT9FP47_9BACT